MCCYKKLVDITNIDSWKQKLSFGNVMVPKNKLDIIYRTRPIITRTLYIYYSKFEVHLFVFKEFFLGEIMSLSIVHIKERFLTKRRYDGARTVDTIQTTFSESNDH